MFHLPFHKPWYSNNALTQAGPRVTFPTIYNHHTYPVPNSMIWRHRDMWINNYFGIFTWQWTVWILRTNLKIMIIIYAFLFCSKLINFRDRGSMSWHFCLILWATSKASHFWSWGVCDWTRIDDKSVLNGAINCSNDTVSH